MASIVSASTRRTKLLVEDSFLATVLIPVFMSYAPSSMSDNEAQRDLLFYYSNTLFAALVVFATKFILINDSMFRYLLLVGQPHQRRVQQAGYSPLLLSCLHPVQQFPPPKVYEVPFLP